MTTKPPSVRDATADDAPELVRLVNGAYREPGEVPGWTDERGLLEGARLDEASLVAILATSRVLAFRQTPDGSIVGCARLDRETDGALYVSTIAVDPTRQNEGIGAVILAAVEREARALRASRLRISVIQFREALIGWYERRGFARTGTVLPFPYDDPSVGRPLRDDLELVVLEKPLSS